MTVPSKGTVKGSYALSMSSPTASAVLARRLARQRLAAPLAGPAGFEALFRRLQPVSTGALVRPASPPRLAHRTRFDSEAEADRLRPSRRIVKGRFQGGGVAYVHADDLATYANAFRRPMGKRSAVQADVYEALRFGGPLTSAQIKEETGLLKKQINPALHRLQEAFLVYEDQVDTSWERAWFDFAAEWPDIDLNDATVARDEAAVAARFFDAFVFATAPQVEDWTQWPAKRVAGVLATLERDGVVVQDTVGDLGTGWLRVGDRHLPVATPPATTFLLDSGDFVSRAHRRELDRRFGRTDVLQYLYAEGRFVGVVRGHWGFKPFDISDVVVEMPRSAVVARRDELLALVRAVYPEPRHRVLCYAGRRVP